MSDISHRLELIETELKETKSIMENLYAMLSDKRKVYTVGMVAKYHGLSVSTVKRSPWLMPNWGESNIAGKHKKWDEKTFREWVNVPVVVRHKEWLTMPELKRQRIMNRAKGV